MLLFSPDLLPALSAATEDFKLVVVADAEIEELKAAGAVFVAEHKVWGLTETSMNWSLNRRVLALDPALLLFSPDLLPALSAATEDFKLVVVADGEIEELKAAGAVFVAEHKVWGLTDTSMNWSLNRRELALDPALLLLFSPDLLPALSAATEDFKLVVVSDGEIEELKAAGAVFVAEHKV
jgi:hypothetical protein